MKTTNLPLDRWNLYVKFLYANEILESLGGPEKQGNLFEVILGILDEILEKYHLPASTQYQQFIYDFAEGRITMEQSEEKLKEASSNYLLSRPQLMKEMLQDIKDGEDIFNCLSNNGFRVYDYTNFVCESFRNGQVTLEDASNDILVFHKHPELSEYLFMLKDKEEKEGYRLFDLIENSGLKCHYKYLDIVEEHEIIHLKGAKVLEMATSDGEIIGLNVKHEGFRDGEELIISMTIDKFFEFIELGNPFELFTEKIVERNRDMEIDKEEFFVYRIDEEDSLVIVAELNIYPVNYNDPEKSPIPNFYLDKIIPNDEGEISKFTKYRSNCGDISPDMDIS